MKENIMWSAEVENKVLQRFLEAIEQITDECKMFIKEDEIYVKEVDPAHISMVEESLKKEAFEQWEIDFEPTEIERKIPKERLSEQLGNFDSIEQIEKMVNEYEELKEEFNSWVKEVMEIDKEYDEIEDIGELLEVEKINLLRDELVEKLEELEEEEEEFEWVTEEVEPNGEIGINVKKLQTALKIMERTELVKIKVNKDATEMKLKGTRMNRRIPLLDVAGLTNPNVPELDLPCRLIVRAKQLKKGVKSCETVSDHMCVEIQEDKMKLSSIEDEDTVGWNVYRDDLEGLEDTEWDKIGNDTLRSLFALKELKKMSSVMNMNDEVTMELGKDYPLKLKFQWGDGNATTQYLLAPRIESA